MSYIDDIKLLIDDCGELVHAMLDPLVSDQERKDWLTKFPGGAIQARYIDELLTEIDHLTQKLTAD